MKQDEVRQRFLSLHHDLDLYVSGGQPGKDELATAPIAELWRPGEYPGTGDPCILAKFILNHPRLGTAPDYISSPVYYADPGNGWVRTQGQLLRLGQRDPEHEALSVRVKEYGEVDRAADLVGYRQPSSELEPTGPMGEDPKWHGLWSWFEENTWSAHDALLVYIARRWHQDISTVYINTDSWMKSKLRQVERDLADHDDYNAGSNYN
ncbi:hypothetical protein [Microvirga pakistanensis]|uniref:hypothetical protein n=1 Tax=Microvirga pakistanensis TaxID=1682650 RepID=UPI00106BA7BB|nr:hypothetical protein [Microvirga pakistanensis]